MPTIAYNDLSDYINGADAAGWPAVTLVCGEELLCKKALDAILDLLIPAADRTTAVEMVDGAEAPVTEALSALNTYALLSATKVVVLHDARLFYSAKAHQGLREKMSAMARTGEMKKAARPLLNLMALAGGFVGGWLGRGVLRHKTNIREHWGMLVVLVAGTLLHGALIYLVFFRSLELGGG